jgi:hypothetical protein
MWGERGLLGHPLNPGSIGLRVGDEGIFREAKTKIQPQINFNYI